MNKIEMKLISSISNPINMIKLNCEYFSNRPTEEFKPVYIMNHVMHIIKTLNYIQNNSVKE